MNPMFRLFPLVLVALALSACGKPYSTAPTEMNSRLAAGSASNDEREHSRAQVFAAAGDIAPAVNAFRDALGALNPNTPGSQTGGRREINWDAVPALFTNTNTFPGDFFNQPTVGRARGLVSATPGTGQRVSDANFTDLSAAFADEFSFFSPIRTFAPVGSNRLTITFFVPGSSASATTSGFGVVFSDVDRRGSATIRLFDEDGESLGRYSAPASPSGLSFVGVMFPDRPVARVEIRSGDAAVSADAVDVSDLRRGDDDADDDDDLRAGATTRGLRVLHRKGHDDREHRRGHDLVIMDDFIFGEPIAPAADLQANSGSGATSSALARR